jgi:hypothetical protein
VKPQFDSDARDELLAAAEWYERRGRPGLGARFSADVELALERITEAPGAFMEMMRRNQVVVRRLMLRDFPFQIVFGVVSAPGGDELWIFAVAHLRREPFYSRTRVERPR